MSWFRRGSTSSTGSGKPEIFTQGKSVSPPHPPTMSRDGMPTSGNTLTSTPRGPQRSDVTTPSPRASPIARRQLRMDTDPATCLVVFQTHWGQAKAIMTKAGASPSIAMKRNAQEDIEAVVRYVDQMALLLVEEDSQDGGQGPILEYLLTEDILEKLLAWSSLHSAEHSDQLKLHQLKMYDLLISQSRQQLLIHKIVIRPLLKLLGMCREHPNTDIEHFLVLILHQLCVFVMQYRHLLELLFDASPDQGPAKFLVFSLLITYIHREGDIGQQARDSLLLIMSLSSVQETVGKYIADNSDFCPVLATGLSGLYSSLPRKLDYPSDDWYQVTSEDIVNMPDLVMFLNSLDFCNAVVQVAHPLVREQLLLFIYNGFLLPVLGPALHQNEITFSDSEDEISLFIDDEDDWDIMKLPISLLESYFSTSMEEVIAATAYLDLFLRRITEPSLIRTFLKFILTAQHDDINILDSLITRINSNSRLCMVTLSLFRTLIDFNCEDVMFELIFKYLIPCNHVMVSQRRAVKDVDLYSKTAEKLLSLRPTCCLHEHTDNIDGRPMTPDNISLNSSSPQSSPGSPIMVSRPRPAPKSTPSSGRKFKQFLLRRGPGIFGEHSAPTTNNVPPRSSSPDIPNSIGSGHRDSLGEKPSAPGDNNERFDTSYLEYLKAMRSQIERCYNACQCWSLPYDGDNPPIDSLETGNLILPSTPLARQYSEPDTPLKSISSTDALPADSSQHPVDNATCDSSENRSTDHMTPNDLEGQKLSHAESVTSEVDSAFSVTSSENVHRSQSSSPQCSDSPLNDNFDSAEFGAFLLSLKRVKTPVELCDSIEDSFSDIDSKLRELALDNIRSNEESTPSVISCPEITELPTILEQVPGDSLPSPPVLTNGIDGQPTMDNSILQGRCPSPLLTPLKRSNSTAPTVGPFLTTLFARLDLMMANTLYVNLLLTGVVTRLACYPQPLLRSFLLNHTLVFQPTVKSLIQVLGSVKHRIDCLSITVKNFDDMLAKARHFLQWREDLFLHSIGEVGPRRESAASFPGALSKGDPAEKKNTIKELFMRSQNAKRQRNDPRLQLLSDKKGFRYVNQRSLPQGNTNQETMADQLEALKAKNAVYCAIVLDEVLKELSAISQEHAILCT